MRLASSFRNLSLGVATATFALAGAAWAQPAAPATQQQPQQQSWNLVGANARLEHKLDVSKLHQGESVDAKLSDTAKTANGMKLPRGTQLWGKVEKVQASNNGSGSSVSIVFDQAVLKDGRHIPVKVTVLGAYPSNEADLAVTGTQTMPPVPNHISSQERVDQEAGMLSHVSVHSAVQSHDSVTFRDSHGNLKLRAGTFLQVGIAPMSTARG